VQSGGCILSNSSKIIYNGIPVGEGNRLPISVTGNVGPVDSIKFTDGKVLPQMFDITKEPTGFAEPDDVIITDNGDRTVTLTGTVNAYWRGVKRTDLVTGYTSPAHANTTTTTFFLTYNGTDIAWRDLSSYALDFSELLIAFAIYDTNNAQWFYLHESHGLMQWESHRAEHNTIGTYKVSGGGSSGVVLSSTTAADRRPAISQTIIRDEDIDTTLPAKTADNYTQGFNTGTGVFNFELDQADMIPVAGAQPFYNLFDTGTSTWGQAQFPANSIATVWVFAIPVCSGTTCQKYRYVFVQPQWITQAANPSAGALATARAAEEARNISELNITTLTALLPESIGILRYTIQYTASNWTVKSELVLGGTKLSQTQTPAGNFLQAVTTDTTLTGLGTGASPLGIDLTNANTWSGVQTFSAFPITPSDAPIADYEVANKKYVDDNSGGDDPLPQILMLGGM